MEERRNNQGRAQRRRGKVKERMEDG